MATNSSSNKLALPAGIPEHASEADFQISARFQMPALQELARRVRLLIVEKSREAAAVKPRPKPKQLQHQDGHRCLEQQANSAR